VADAAPPELSDLCADCGMCCSGALFEWVPLEDHEVAEAQRLGLPVEAQGDKTVFTLPCTQVLGKRCMIYADRPAMCATYECTTLRALRLGEIDRSEADRRVASALTALGRAREALLPGETIPEARKRFRSTLAERGRQGGASRFMMLLAALDLHLDRYFRYKEQRHLQLDGRASPGIAAPEPKQAD
jgi:uncharacterized protein